jgi:hypothetical protein
MLTPCSEETALFMGQSLTNHAREIHRYAQQYCHPANNAYMDDDTRAQYAGNLERMLNEMYSIMLMANYKGVSRVCNREQIDAHLEAAYEIIAPKPVTDYAALNT